MTTGTKVTDLPNVGAAATARRKYHHVLNGGSLTAQDVAGMVEAIERLEAALARQEADKTKAAIWIEFAENGNIRFWTSDQDRAIEESFCHARSLTAYYAAPPAAQAVDLDGLRELADAVVITNATGNERLFLGAVEKLLARVRALIDQQAGKGVDRG